MMMMMMKIKRSSQTMAFLDEIRKAVPPFLALCCAFVKVEIILKS